MRLSETCKRSLLMVLLCLLGLPGVQAADQFKVVVSIKPVHSIVAGLMEGAEGPELLIGDAQTPYEFELSGPQRTNLEQADLLIWTGPELEGSLLGPIGELGSQVQVVELLSSPSMKLLPSRFDDSLRDPFFWMDNRNVVLLLNDLTRLLQEADPKRAHLYTQNRRKVMQRLSRVDRELEYGYRGLKAGLSVQYYDTLQYFEQAYALTVLDTVSASPRHQADAMSLLKVRERINNGEAVCLLTDISMPVQHQALLTGGQQVNLGELDVLGRQWQAGPDLYFKLMQHTTDAIKRCLNADMQAAEKTRLLAQQEHTPVADGIGLGRFMLTDHYGRLVTEESLRGKYQLLYFGYTYCPDICPNTLQIVSLALDQLGDAADRIQPYFITIDPERDTVKVMRNYVEYFDQRMIGLTGSKPMIENIAALYKAKFEKVEAEGDDPELYLMDHSASLYLLAPDGSFITKFAYGLSAEQLVLELKKIIR
ncbi:MAG: SCO family protein [Pseudomonadota bacterium]